VLKEARERASRVFGEDHPITLDLQHRLSRVLSDEERWDEAGELAEQTLAARRRVLAPASGRTAYTMVVVARVLLERGELDRAESLLQEARTVFRENYADQPRLAAAAENWLGAVYLARHNLAEAERALLPLREQFLAPTIQMSPRERRECLKHIVQLYEALQQPEQAAEWRRQIERIGDSGSEPLRSSK
jgi:tetratricopeptide (TPR) repeat protein